MRTFQTNFNDKLLVHFCTLLAGRFSTTPLLYFSEPMDSNKTQLVHYCTLLVGGYTINPISYIFWAGGVK